MLQVFYYRTFPAISSSNQTNTLLTTYPLIYLEGCLFEAFAFMQDTDLSLSHFARYRDMVTGVNTSINSVRYGGGPLRVRPRLAIP